MPFATVWRWVGLRLLRSPLLALAALLLVAALPLLEALRAVPSPAGARELAAGFAFPAAILGTLLTLATLDDGASLLARLDPADRARAEAGALVLGALYLQLPILAGLLLSEGTPSEALHLLPAILTTGLHLAGVASLHLQLPVTSALRASLFLVVVWLLPPLAGFQPVLARGLALVDCGAALRAGGGAVLPSLCAAGALLLAGILRRLGAGEAHGGVRANG